MLGGYLEFFMNPTVADLFQCLRRELDDLIHMKVGDLLKSTLFLKVVNTWFILTHCFYVL